MRRARISSFTAGIAVKVINVGAVATLRPSGPAISTRVTPIARRTGVKTNVLVQKGRSGATAINTAIITRGAGDVGVLPPTHPLPHGATITGRLSLPIKGTERIGVTSPLSAEMIAEALTIVGTFRRNAGTTVEVPTVPVTLLWTAAVLIMHVTPPWTGETTIVAPIFVIRDGREPARSDPRTLAGTTTTPTVPLAR
jgi:hypothetical protein